MATENLKLLRPNLRFPLYVDKRGMLYRYHKEKDGLEPVAIKRRMNGSTDVLYNYFSVNIEGKTELLTQPDLRKFYAEGGR